MAVVASACGNREHATAIPTPGALSLSARPAGTTSIDLAWVAPDDVDATNGIRVFRDNVLVAMSAGEGWTDRGLTPATNYTYRVVSIDGDGRESGVSNTATATTSIAIAIAISVSPTAASIEVGDTFRFTAAVRDSATGQPLTGHQITWTSSDAALATVGTDGLVTAIATGSVTISASSDGRTASAAVTVSPRSAVSVKVTPGQSSIQATKTAALTATAHDRTGAVLAGRTFTWTSSDPTVATVSPAGVVTGVAAGSVTIAATTDGVTGTAAVSVVSNAAADPDIASLTVNPPTLALSVGTTSQISATARDGNGVVLTNKPVTWSTSDPATATVSQTGSVAAVANGSAVITATSGGLTASSMVTVTTAGGPPPGPASVANVSVTPSTSTISTGATVQLNATTRDANGNTLTGRTITWSSSNTSVSTVSASGLVTSISAGAAIISATSEGVSGSATITVTAPAPVPVASVVIAPGSVSMAIGATAQLTATTKDAQGNTLGGRVVTWSSSDPAVATVSAAGLVTGVSLGAAVITATSEGISSTITATITPKPVVSVIINNAGPVCIGSALQLTATPRDIDGNPLTGRVVVWTTSTGALASVSPTGLVLGVALGTVTITATVEGVSASVNIGICAPIVATVTISKPSSTISLLSGLLLQLTAVAKDANGNVISGRPVTWSVTPQTRALISLGGLLTPLLAGDVTVTATIDGVEATTVIGITLF